MRGKMPRPLTVTPDDLQTLKIVARSPTEPHFRVQRARIILDVHNGKRIQDIAEQLDCAPSTIWRTCRRYEARGLAAILAESKHTSSAIPTTLAEPNEVETVASSNTLEQRAASVGSNVLEVPFMPEHNLCFPLR